MPVFSTNPEWYNSAGVLDRVLKGTANKNKGYDNIAIGYNSIAGSSTVTIGINSAIAIGYDAQASGNDSIAIGSRSSEDYGTYAFADGAISIGAGSQVRGDDSIGIGYGVITEGMSSIAIGNKAEASEQYSIAIGNGATANANNTIQIGNNNMAYTLKIGNIGQIGNDEMKAISALTTTKQEGYTNLKLYLMGMRYRSDTPNTYSYYILDADSNTGGSVVGRNIRGGIYASSPQQNNEVATKEYVDTAIANAIAAASLK